VGWSPSKVTAVSVAFPGLQYRGVSGGAEGFAMVAVLANVSGVLRITRPKARMGRKEEITVFKKEGIFFLFFLFHL
jgi:hypothetical protein